MKCLTVIRAKERNLAYQGVISFGVVLALLLTASACRVSGEPSDEQIENAKTAVATIRGSLYMPMDATILTEKLLYGTNPEIKPGCVRGFILVAYRSPRDFSQILTEYREALKATDWEPSPYHSHDQNNIDIFILGTQDLLTVSAFPLRPDLLPVPSPANATEQLFTNYYLELSHYDPSILECRGG